MTETNTINSFKAAMEAVYGPLDNLSEEDASNWVPPSSPGAGGHRGRYLWTDAFGVVNFLTMYKETSKIQYLHLATRLVQAVHDVLGRERDGVNRLPGATDDSPLAGGLRIGKLTDAGSDCDGQYHHYLTIWMFALNRMSLATGDPRFNNWAIDLAKAIHNHFVKTDDSGIMRMVWKISTDMKDVLVPSEGHLDAATGFTVYRLLQETLEMYDKDSRRPLDSEIEDYSVLMMRPGKLAPTTDFLDLGMGLWMCHWCYDEPWADELSRLSREMLQSHFRPATGRPVGRYKALAFREFGAYLGVRCVGADEALEATIDTLLESWETIKRNVDQDLKPISHVMYSSALMPGGKLTFPRCTYGRLANEDSVSPRLLPESVA
jgi:hypothetical protein